jgi:hypothetical protein
MTKNIINKIARDKKDHVLLGMFWGYPLITLGLIIDLMLGLNFMAIIGGSIGIILVGGKEVVHDWILGKGNPEWWDFIASAIPILFPMIIIIIK